MQLVVRRDCQRTCYRKVSLTSFSSDLADLGKLHPRVCCVFTYPRVACFGAMLPSVAVVVRGRSQRECRVLRESGFADRLGCRM
jgi:hypothetical protein